MAVNELIMRETKTDCCDGSGSPGLTAIAEHIENCRNGSDEILDIHFDHGLGDVVHFAALLNVLQQMFNTHIRICAEENKRAAWEAAGIELVGQGIYHRWTYPNDFNYPGANYDALGSKIFGNILLNHGAVKERLEVFDNLCDLNMETWLPRIISKETQNEINEWLKGLTQPFILLHTNGTNFPGGKNIENQNELYNLLLDSFDGTLILLDWDFRVEYFPHSRIRHTKHLAGHINLYQLAALYAAAHQSGGMLIGIDSGPYHYALMHPIRALGVFHHHYPACVTLPSRKQVCMTRSAESYKPCNLLRRKRWNIVEYDGVMPSPKDIVKHAMRLLNECRYTNDQSKIGIDVSLQQWVRDWLRQHQSLSPRADRDTSMDKVFQLLRLRENPVIVETGCIRSNEDWSAGYSTYLFAAFLHNSVAGKLYSVDTNKQNLLLAKGLCATWDNAKICFVHQDSCKFLEEFKGTIDLLYLDSLDTYEHGCAEHGLDEFKAAEHALNNKSIVMYDDTTFDKNEWKGKGALGVPYMLANGWRAISCGYQVVLVKD
jgi:hypothetical protein